MLRLLAVLVVLSAVAPALAQDTDSILPPPGGELVVEDFEWCSQGALPPIWRQWTNHQGMSAGVEEVTRPAGQVARALALAGKVQKGGRDLMQLEVSRDLYLPSLATGLVLPITGRAPQCGFHVRVRDVGGECFGFMAPCPQDDAWREVRVSLDEASAGYHYGGGNDGKLDWPLVLQSVSVAAQEDADAGAEFRIAIDEIRAAIPLGTPIPVADCEEGELPFGLFGENLGDSAVSVGPDETAPGVTCTWLDYAWGPGDPRPNSFAELLHRTPLGVGEGTVFAWMRGDGSHMLVSFRVQDAKGEFWQITPHNAFMFWRNWRCVFLDVMVPDERCWMSSSAGDGKLDPPFTFHSIVIDDWAGPERLDEIPASPAKGRIGIGPVWYVGWEG